MTEEPDQVKGGLDQLILKIKAVLTLTADIYLFTYLFIWCNPKKKQTCHVLQSPDNWHSIRIHAQPPAA